MSRLPKGTKAARALTESVALDGAMAYLAGISGFFGLPIIKQIVRKALEELLVDPALDQVVAYGLAGTYVLDRREFDMTFIELSMLDAQNLPPEELEKALVQAEEAMFKLVRRGPVE